MPKIKAKKRKPRWRSRSIRDRRLVAVDIDGVLAKFAEALIEVYNRRHVGNGRPLNANLWLRYRIEDQFGWAEAEHLYDILHEPGFFASLRVHDGAREAMDDLSTSFDIEICTSPPSTIHAKTGHKAISAAASGDKVGWIVREFPDQAAGITITKDKSRLRADGLVDDCTDNVHDWCKAHPRGFGYLVARPWNAGAMLPPNARRGPLEGAAQALRDWFARGGKGKRRQGRKGVRTSKTQ